MLKFFYVEPYNASSYFQKLEAKIKKSEAESSDESKAKLVVQDDFSIEISYCTNTHGLSNLFTSIYTGSKIFWAVLTVVSTVLSVYFIQQTLQDYFKFHVITEVRLMDADKGMEFPVNNFKYSKTKIV
jgi:hypothetical protein